MIVKESQLDKQKQERTEWPMILTPEQREQLLREKMDRAVRAHLRLRQHEIKDFANS